MSAPAAIKKVRAAKRKTTPSKEAPKAKRGDGQRVSTHYQIRGGIKVLSHHKIKSPPFMMNE